MRVEKLDTLVTEHLTNRIFDPDHLASLLGSLAERHAERAAFLLAWHASAATAPWPDSSHERGPFRAAPRGAKFMVAPLRPCLDGLDRETPLA